MSALGVPLSVSLQALFAFGAAPGRVGRALVGFSILEWAAGVLREPLLFALYNATFKVAPGTVWWVAAVSAVYANLVKTDRLVFVCARYYVHSVSLLWPV